MFKSSAIICLSVFSVLVGLVSHSSLHAAKLPSTVGPDLTLPETDLPYNKPDNRLGTTGAHGWIYYDTRDQKNGEGVTQILVTRVDPGTPADGFLKKGDIIFGAAAGRTCSPFRMNAREEMAMALLEAEDESNAGNLALLTWQQGEIVGVRIAIPVIKGSYDEKAPLTSGRTQTLIEDLAEVINSRGLKDHEWQDVFDALGLMATGDNKYLSVLKKFADSMILTESLTLDAPVGKKSWIWGYKTLFLAEYYGYTGDKSILPTLTQYATQLARGQAYAGTWGHTIADPNDFLNDGQLHGRLPGYGAINQTTLTCANALVIARKVGVDNKEISDAITRSTVFFRFFTEKGAIPYGDHMPINSHAGNGKNAQAALFFDLINDQRGANYFTKITLASSRSREGGHTGHFFSQFWGGPGAAVAGEEGLNAFLRHQQFYYQLERGPNAESYYQSEMHGQIGRYKNWSTNGCRLLLYCAPRKALYITGKDRSVPALSSAEVEAAVHSGRRKKHYENLSTKDVARLLGDWSHQVRKRAVKMLAHRGEKNLVPGLIAMLKGDNRFERYGACEALGVCSWGSEDAAKALVEYGLKSKDPNTRFFAVKAFTKSRYWVNGAGWRWYEGGLGDASMLGVEELLKMAIRPDPADPQNRMHFLLSEILFYNGRVARFKGLLSDDKFMAEVDRDLLFAAARSILENQNGRARQHIATTVYPILTKAEVADLQPDIVKAVAQHSQSGMMFAWVVRTRGLDLLAKHNAAEVPKLAAYLIDNIDKPNVVIDFIKSLEHYKGNPEDALPSVRRYVEGQEKKAERLAQGIKDRPSRAKGYKRSLDSLEKQLKDLRKILANLESQAN